VDFLHELVNPRAEASAGQPLLGRRLLEVFDPEDVPLFEAYRDLVGSGASLRTELRVHTPVGSSTDGRRFQVYARAVGQDRVVCQYQDVTQERVAHEALRRDALQDELTGLPNRRAWHERVERELQRARRFEQPLRVAVIDLDGLKQTNDRFGHGQGDRLIQRSADAWSDALRQSDFLARLGGDEFVLLLPDCTAAVAEEIARRMIDAVPFEKTCSVGVATWDGNEASYELVHRADQAMYTVKAGGGGGIGIAATSQASLVRASSPSGGPVAV